MWVLSAAQINKDTLGSINRVCFLVSFRLLFSEFFLSNNFLFRNARFRHQRGVQLRFLGIGTDISTDEYYVK